MATDLWFFRFEKTVPAPIHRSNLTDALLRHGIEPVGGSELHVPEHIAGGGCWVVDGNDVMEVAFERLVFGAPLDALARELCGSLGLTAIGSWGETVVPPCQAAEAPILDGAQRDQW